MPIIHIVSFKYKAAVSPAARQEGLERFKALKTECKLTSGGNYITEIQAGAKNISPEGHGKDFDQTFILTFPDSKSINHYLDVDPAHAAFKEFILPMLDDAFIFDFEV